MAKSAKKTPETPGEKPHAFQAEVAKLYDRWTELESKRV